jgi:hypothetical protein
MKMVYRAGVAWLGLSCLSSLSATYIKEAEIEIQDDELLLPSSPPCRPSQAPRPFISSILSDRHPAGAPNIIDNVNQGRGEGLPYTTSPVLIDLLTEGYKKKEEKGKERVSAEEIENGHYIVPIIKELPLEVHERTLRNWFRFSNSLSFPFKNTELLHYLDAVPVSEWKKRIQTLLPLLLPLEDQSQRIWVIETVNALPIGRYDKAFAEIEPVLTHITKRGEQELKEIIRDFVRVSPQERGELLLVKMEHFLGGITNGWERERIIEVIREIPAEERGGLLARAGPFVSGIKNVRERASIIRAIKEIPAEEREEVLTRAEPFINGITDGQERANIIKANKLPAQEQEEVLTRAAPFVSGITDGWGRERIIEVIREIPAEERGGLLARAGPFLNGFNGWYKALIIDAIRVIPAEERRDVLTRAEPFIRGIINGWDRRKIIGAIGEIPAEEREKVLIRAEVFMGGITDGSQRARILEAIREILAEERGELLARAEPFINGITDGEERIRILEAIREILAEEREEVRAEPFLNGITDGQERARILEAISKIPKNLSDNIFTDILEVSKIIGLCFKPESMYRIGIFSAIASIPAEERMAVLKLLIPYMLGKDEHEIAFILNLITRTPPNKQQHILNKGLILLERLPSALGRAITLKLFQESSIKDWESLVNKVCSNFLNPQEVKNHDIEIDKEGLL